MDKMALQMLCRVPVQRSSCEMRRERSDDLTFYHVPITSPDESAIVRPAHSQSLFLFFDRFDYAGACSVFPRLPSG
jgi:hypothetical protein